MNLESMKIKWLIQPLMISFLRWQTRSTFEDDGVLKDGDVVTFLICNEEKSDIFFKNNFAKI